MPYTQAREARDMSDAKTRVCEEAASKLTRTFGSVALGCAAAIRKGGE